LDAIGYTRELDNVADRTELPCRLAIPTQSCSILAFYSRQCSGGQYNRYLYHIGSMKLASMIIQPYQV